MILADKIIALRKQRGWTQVDLAAELHISRQAVSKWESAQSLPDLGNLQRMSELFGVSLDDLVSEDVILPDEPAPQQEEVEAVSAAAAGGASSGVAAGSTSEMPQVRRVSMAEANAYLRAVQQASRMIGMGALLLILSCAPFNVLALMSSSKEFALDEDIVLPLTMLLVLLVAIPSVVLFILAGGRLNRFSYLSKVQIETEYGVSGFVQRERENFSTQYFLRISSGVALCISGVVLGFAAAVLADAFGMLYSLVLIGFFACVGAGVYLLIRAGMRWVAYNRLLEEGEYTLAKKRVNKIIDPIASVYWPVVTVVYLLWSFMSGAWGITWVVWPVAGALYAAIVGVTTLLLDRDK